MPERSVLKPNRSMYRTHTPRKFAIVGPGMITVDQLLPAAIQMWFEGVVTDILIAGQGLGTLTSLLESSDLRTMFPDFPFELISTFPDLNGTGKQKQSRYHYREMFKQLSPGDIVMVAVPDHLHTKIVLEAVKLGLFVICVKSLTTNLADARKIAKAADANGVAVFIDLHKFADPYVLRLLPLIREGRFGAEFLGGRATMMESDAYWRKSNFYKWFLRNFADPATYVACHYIDQVWMLLGMMPVKVFVSCHPDEFPQGGECYNWSTTVLEYANGASFTVQNSLLQPSHGPTGNHQGLELWFKGKEGRGASIRHDDHSRGALYVYDPDSVPEGNKLLWSGSQYMQMLARLDGSPGNTIAGYGYDSIRIMSGMCMELADIKHLQQRRKRFEIISAANIVPTAQNREWLGLVYEAMRMSIETGLPVDLDYAQGICKTSVKRRRRSTKAEAVA